MNEVSVYLGRQRGGRGPRLTLVAIMHSIQVPLHALRLPLLHGTEVSTAELAVQIYQIIWLHAGGWGAGNSVKAFQHIIYVFTKGLSTCEHPLQSLYGIVTQLCLRSADLHSMYMYIYCTRQA